MGPADPNHGWASGCPTGAHAGLTQSVLHLGCPRCGLRPRNRGASTTRDPGFRLGGRTRRWCRAEGSQRVHHRCLDRVRRAGPNLHRAGPLRQDQRQDLQGWRRWPECRHRLASTRDFAHPHRGGRQGEDHREGRPLRRFRLRRRRTLRRRITTNSQPRRRRNEALRRNQHSSCRGS